jgi:hypothetical protein
LKKKQLNEYLNRAAEATGAAVVTGAEEVTGGEQIASKRIQFTKNECICPMFADLNKRCKVKMMSKLNMVTESKNYERKNTRFDCR